MNVSYGAYVDVRKFLIETGVQALIGAVIWVLIARDATRVREERDSTPAGISPFAWGALCGLTWIAIIGYLTTRNRPSASCPEPGVTVVVCGPGCHEASSSRSMGRRPAI